MNPTARELVEQWLATQPYSPGTSNYQRALETLVTLMEAYVEIRDLERMDEAIKL